MLRGAAWDNSKHTLKEATPGSSQDHPMPVVWLIPSAAVRHEQCLVREVDVAFDSGRFLCPLYYGIHTPQRGPEATQNDADMSLAVLPLQGGMKQVQWVKRGVCLVATGAGIHILPKSANPESANQTNDDMVVITLPARLQAEGGHALQAINAGG